MNLVFRILVLLVVVPVTFYFLLAFPFSILDVPGRQILGGALAATVTTLFGWAIWNRLGDAPGHVARDIILGAFLAGGIGFAGGFFGPIILTPDANQGPLLGIFVTGPLGFIVGAIGGLAYGAVRSRRDA